MRWFKAKFMLINTKLRSRRFSGLDDSQLGCIKPGDVIELPAGAVLVSQGDRFSFFFFVLKREIRLSRTYDRQSIVMGVIKRAISRAKPLSCSILPDSRRHASENRRNRFGSGRRFLAHGEHMPLDHAANSPNGGE